MDEKTLIIKLLSNQVSPNQQEYESERLHIPRDPFTGYIGLNLFLARRSRSATSPRMNFIYSYKFTRLQLK